MNHTTPPFDPDKINILMDLPTAVDPAVLEKIGRLMPIELFLDGVLMMVYNENDMRHLLDSIQAAVSEIKDEAKRLEYEDSLMELINDHAMQITEAFRESLKLMAVMTEDGRRWVVEMVKYDSPSQTLAATLLVGEEEDELDEEDIAVATEIIDDENTEEEGDDEDDMPLDEVIETEETDD